MTWQQRLIPVITMCLVIALLPHLEAAPRAPVYSTDFENVTKEDPYHLNMGIDNLFVFHGDGGATMWMEGLDRKTPNINCHSGTRCVGMEITDITKSRRAEFNLMHMQNLVGNELFISYWLYLPADWQLHPSGRGDWYEIVNPYFTDGGLPYSSIHILQDTPRPIFDLTIDYHDLSGAQHMLDIYNNFSLPRGRWFHVQYYVLRSSTDGILRIWFDDKLVTNRAGLQTKGPIEDWLTAPAKVYYDTNDTFSPYRIWVDDLTIYNGEVTTVTSVSLNARLDTSSSPPTVLISGSIYPAPGRSLNVTLEYSSNQGGTYQEIGNITSAADGTFRYSWNAPRNNMLMIRADAQGVKSSAVSIGIAGVPGFPSESLLVGSALGLLTTIMRRKQRVRRIVDPSWRRKQV